MTGILKAEAPIHLDRARVRAAHLEHHLLGGLHAQRRQDRLAGVALGERGDGFRTFLKILDGGRISIAALAIGIAQAELFEMVARGKQEWETTFDAMSREVCTAKREVTATPLQRILVFALLVVGLTLAAAAQALRSSRRCRRVMQWMLLVTANTNL